MKVFSKSNKNNKSTPLLQHLADINSTKHVVKPKGISKVMNYKTKILQSSNEQSVKFQSTPRIYSSKDLLNGPKSGRTNYLLDKQSKIQKSFQIEAANQYRPQLHSIPLISSVEYKNSLQTQSENRSQTDSVQLIESVLCYGKKLGGKQNIKTNESIKYTNLDQTTKTQNSKSIKQNNQEETKANTNISSFKVLAESFKTINIANIKQAGNFVEQKNHEKENILINALSHNSQKQYNKKQINSYKNSKLNQYILKPVQRRLSLDCFKLGRKLGRGRFGCVYIAQEIKTGMIFALKLVDLQQVKEQQMENQIIQEIKLQMYMNHPNILKMYGFFKQGQQLCMILEYADQKCLFSLLQQKLPQSQVAYFTRQMIEALKYCHSQFILHRDLKPQNILLCRRVAKLADFGWAAYAPRYKRITFCGTLDYVPPEILKGDYYDQKVDIWSLGVLIYEMATGRAPFESKSINPVHIQTKTMNRIIKGDLVIPSYLSAQLRKLIESILMTQPQKRPTLEEIEANSWLRSYKEVGAQILNRVWQFWAESSH